MNNLYPKAYLYLAIAVLLQLEVLPIISLDGVLPNLAMIVLFFFSLQRSRLWGIITAAVFGLLFDIIAGNSVGSSMFSMSLSLYIGGLFMSEQKNERILRSYQFIAIILLIATINSIVFSLLTNLDIRSSIVSLLFKQGLFPGLYTAAFASFVVIVQSRRN